jgi:outer membrane protein assembly factor BamB
MKLINMNTCAFYHGLALCCTFALFSQVDAENPVGKQVSDLKIQHSFLITGPDTALIDESSKIVWRCRGDSRDGFALANGNFLIAWKNEVLEMTQANKVVFRYRLSGGNREIGTVAPLDKGRFLITELGPKPRLIEVNHKGQVEVGFPLKPETTNAHMQTRMARKNVSGNYWVPHLLAHSIKEYNVEGEVLRTFRTDSGDLGGRDAKNWPFTAIELDNGNLLVGCTMGNKVVEFNPDGKVVWKVDNTKVGGLIQDACGVQRLDNGNTVIASYRAGKGRPKMLEVDPDGKVLWTFESDKLRAVHHFQVLTTNGKKEARALK